MLGRKGSKSTTEFARGDISRLQEGEAALTTEWFEPPSKRELYNAELQMRTKQPNEGLADFAQELRRLTEKAFQRWMQRVSSRWPYLII